MRILFDNNIFDEIIENYDFFTNAKKNTEFFVSPSALEELANMKDVKREKRITNLISLVQLEPKFLLDAVVICDYSRCGCCKISDAKVYKEILGKSGSIRDAILAETAVNNDCYLLTNDKNLYKKMKKFGYKVLNIEDFKNEYGK